MENKVVIIPESIVELAEFIRRSRKEGIYRQMIITRRRSGMTWAKQLADAEDATITEQKQLKSPDNLS